MGMGFQHLLPGLGRHGRMAISLLFTTAGLLQIKTVRLSLYILPFDLAK